MKLDNYSVNLSPVLELHGYTSDRTSYSWAQSHTTASTTANSNWDPDHAFDENVNSYPAWASGFNGFPAWIRYDFGAGNEKRIERMNMAIYSKTDRADNKAKMPKDFSFQGSNDGSNWTTLGSWTNQIWTSMNWGDSRNYSFENPNSYRYYRVYVTSTNGFTEVVIGELQFMEGIYA